VRKKKRRVPHHAVGLVKLSDRTDVYDRDGRRRGKFLVPHLPPVGGVLLDSVPLAPRASEAFTPEEFDARVLVMQARVAARLPVGG
jgi:hypothetical protein